MTALVSLWGWKWNQSAGINIESQYLCSLFERKQFVQQTAWYYVVAMKRENAPRTERWTKFEVNFFARVSLFVTLFVLIIFGIIEFFTNDIFILAPVAMMGGV